MVSIDRLRPVYNQLEISQAVEAMQAYMSLMQLRPLGLRTKDCITNLILASVIFINSACADLAQSQIQQGLEPPARREICLDGQESRYQLYDGDGFVFVDNKTGEEVMRVTPNEMDSFQVDVLGRDGGYESYSELNVKIRPIGWGDNNYALTLIRDEKSWPVISIDVAFEDCGAKVDVSGPGRFGIYSYYLEPQEAQQLRLVLESNLPDPEQLSRILTILEGGEVSDFADASGVDPSRPLTGEVETTDQSPVPVVRDKDENQSKLEESEPFTISITDQTDIDDILGHIEAEDPVLLQNNPEFATRLKALLESLQQLQRQSKAKEVVLEIDLQGGEDKLIEGMEESRLVLEQELNKARQEQEREMKDDVKKGGVVDELKGWAATLIIGGVLVEVAGGPAVMTTLIRLGAKGLLNGGRVVVRVVGPLIEGRVPDILVTVSGATAGLLALKMDDIKGLIKGDPCYPGICLPPNTDIVFIAPVGMPDYLRRPSGFKLQTSDGEWVDLSIADVSLMVMIGRILLSSGSKSNGIATDWMQSCAPSVLELAAFMQMLDDIHDRGLVVIPQGSEFRQQVYEWARENPGEAYRLLSTLAEMYRMRFGPEEFDRSWPRKINDWLNAQGLGRITMEPPTIRSYEGPQQLWGKKDGGKESDGDDDLGPDLGICQPLPVIYNPN